MSDTIHHHTAPHRHVTINILPQSSECWLCIAIALCAWAAAWGMPRFKEAEAKVAAAQKAAP